MTSTSNNRNLEVITTTPDILRSSMYPTMVWGPKNTNQVYRSPHHSSSEEDDSCSSSRGMIRRSFAFDEWDDDNNEKEEKDVAMMSNEEASLDQAQFRDAYQYEDDNYLREEDLQSVIRQCFAFDEWDVKNARTELPEQKGDQEDASGRIVNLFQSSLALESAATPNTKFGSTIITPSPTSKQCENEGRMSIKEPIPLYSHERNSIPTDQGTITASSFPNFENSQPANYTQLEELFRKEFKESNVNNFPPYYCQGIPRRASAFRAVTGNNHNIDGNHHNCFPATNPSSSLERTDGATTDSPLLEEHYIFESPTNSLSEDSSNVPSFIVCYSENKDTLNE